MLKFRINEIYDILDEKNILVLVSKKTPGRPNLLDKKLGWEKLSKEILKFKKNKP